MKKKEKNKYWLFWDHRGYMHYEIFTSREKAVRRFREEDDGYQFPILIEGREIDPKEEK